MCAAVIMNVDLEPRCITQAAPVRITKRFACRFATSIHHGGSARCEKSISLIRVLVYRNSCGALALRIVIFIFISCLQHSDGGGGGVEGCIISLYKFSIQPESGSKNIISPVTKVGAPA